MGTDETAVRAALHQWFRRPPRPHGDIDYDREVSFLELFYDLVYVVLIAQVSHHFAAHITWRGALDFAVVFGLIWFAWINGTVWHELHAREDGRSRNFIFVQMLLLATLAVFAGDATGADGPAFAVTYTILFALYTYQWWLVQRVDDPSYRPITVRYLAGMGATVTLVAVSAAVPDAETRLGIWAVLVVGWLVGGVAMLGRSTGRGSPSDLSASLVERIGLLTIIVLGEVVVGVVGGMSEVEELGPATLATGLIGLTIGFGIWWNYFDALGRRVPARQGWRMAAWMYVHLPLTMAIAGGGAGMVSLVEHATDPRAPSGAAWVIAGAVAVVLASVATATRALPDDAFPPGVIERVPTAYATAAGVVLVIAAIRPSPVVFVTLVSLTLAGLWFHNFALIARGRAGLEDGAPEVVERVDRRPLT